MGETMTARRMTTLLLPAIFLLTLLAVPRAEAQTQLWTQPSAGSTRTLADLKGGGAFGLGFSAGTRNGLTMKIWPTRAHGIIIDVGAPPFLGSLAIAAGYRGHFKPLVPPTNAIAAMPYIGGNFRLRVMFMPGSDPAALAEFGAGVPFGVSITVPQWPVELFVEAGPVVVFWKDVSGGVGVSLDVDGLAGARMYF